MSREGSEALERKLKLMSKSGDIWQEKVLWKWHKKFFLIFKTRRHVSKEEALRRKINLQISGNVFQEKVVILNLVPIFDLCRPVLKIEKKSFLSYCLTTSFVICPQILNIVFLTHVVRFWNFEIFFFFSMPYFLLLKFVAWFWKLKTLNFDMPHYLLTCLLQFWIL